ncbi:MAG: hypothetical protein DRJ67_08495 [Thermoprotei archaeon]|nr:MAG: hypothetical protein DRJ67_08495 [Thermoprotei archaeon]
MRAVANSTPLIAKAKAPYLLFEVYEEDIIPPAVYDEVAVRGLEKGYRDAGLVKAAVEEGSIRVEEPSRSIEETLGCAPMLHRSEAGVTALALRHRACLVLQDERAARLVARALGPEVHGTLYVVMAAAAREVMPVEEALEMLNRLVAEGFRISVELT